MSPIASAIKYGGTGFVILNSKVRSPLAAAGGSEACSALITALRGNPKPTVALLNIGSEEIKGNDTIRAAAAMLQASPLNYVGFVEGDGIFLQDIDVVVCDGFVGNVALKTGEGVAKMIRQFLKE